MNRKILFISVDDLLSMDDVKAIEYETDCRCTLAPLNDNMILAINKVPDWHIVLITSTETKKEYLTEITKRIHQNRIIDTIAADEDGADIATPISTWLNNEGEVEDYVVLCDGVGMSSSHSNHYIRIDQSKGLSHVLAATLFMRCNKDRDFTNK